MKTNTLILLILLGIVFLYLGIVIHIAWKNGDFNSTIVYKPNYPMIPNYSINFTSEK
jgi:hypothetical protein